MNKVLHTFELDPLLTWLLKECFVELLPAITFIINASIKHVPTSFKVAYQTVDQETRHY